MLKTVLKVSLTCHQGHVSGGGHLHFSICESAFPRQLVDASDAVTSSGRGPMSVQNFEGTWSKIGDM